MGRGSVKRFQNKHGARTFKLVPVGMSSDGSIDERVFVEITPGAERRELRSLQDAFVDVVGDGDDDEPATNGGRSSAHNTELAGIGEAAKFGIMYDDRHYDYMQHLKTIGETPGGVLVSAPRPPDLSDAVYLEELRRLDEAVYKDIKSVALDPVVLEVLEALEDDAYHIRDLADDFVTQLDMESDSPLSEDSGSDTIIDIDGDQHAAASCCSDDVERILGAVRDDEHPKLTRTEAKESERRKGFAEVDEMRKELLGEGPLRLPSDLSEFDSDEYFRELEDGPSQDDDPINGTFGSANSAPAIIPVISVPRRAKGLMVSSGQNADAVEDGDDAPKENLGQRRDKMESKEGKKQRKNSIKQARRERRSEKKEHRVLFGAK